MHSEAPEPVSHHSWAGMARVGYLDSRHPSHCAHIRISQKGRLPRDRDDLVAKVAVPHIGVVCFEVVGAAYGRNQNPVFASTSSPDDVEIRCERAGSVELRAKSRSQIPKAKPWRTPHPGSWTHVGAVSGVTVIGEPEGPCGPPGSPTCCRQSPVS